MFDLDQLDRYGRQLLLPEIGPEGQRRLLDARVLVIGAGGLGAPVLAYLAAAGVGAGAGVVTLLDDDLVDVTNLQRQVLFTTDDVGRPKAEAAADRLRRLNPALRLDARRERFTAANARSLVAAAELVIDGSDNFATRYLANDACVLEDRPLVYGAASRFEGQLSVFHWRHDGVLGPCYRCLYPEPPPAGTVPSCAEAGVLGALTGVVGAMMAAEALKLLSGAGTPRTGVLLHLDLLAGTQHAFAAPRDPACPLCGEAPTLTDLAPEADRGDACEPASPGSDGGRG